MLDSDLAELYGVPTKRLNEQVRRNIARFPEDFMFQLTKEEAEASRFHFGTLNKEEIMRLQNGISSSEQDMRSQNAAASKRNERFFPYAFTEQGVAMLSSVLRSERAILVNIQIIRTFTKIREMLEDHKELREKIESMENKYDSQFKVVFDAIKRLINPPEPPKPKIGFRT